MLQTFIYTQLIRNCIYIDITRNIFNLQHYNYYHMNENTFDYNLQRHLKNIS